MTLTPPRPTVVPDAPADLLSRLVRRSATGDVDAFAELYDATVAPVYGLALNVLGDENLACEVVRRAYAEVWRGAAAWSPEPGPSAAAWIVSTAHRLALAHVRTHGTAIPVGPSATVAFDGPRSRRRDVA